MNIPICMRLTKHYEIFSKVTKYLLTICSRFVVCAANEHEHFLNELNVGGSFIFNYLLRPHLI